MKKNIIKTFVVIYLCAFIAANLLVKHYGAFGLWISSALLIPFDFVCRCIFHERWSGKGLVFRLSVLTMLSGVITFAINHEAQFIAAASFFGFIAAQFAAGIFYQRNKDAPWWYKVNVSDVFAIVADSIVFQWVAFGTINFAVTGGQIGIKIAGGVLWYFILFRWLNIEKYLQYDNKK